MSVVAWPLCRPNLSLKEVRSTHSKWKKGRVCAWRLGSGRRCWVRLRGVFLKPHRLKITPLCIGYTVSVLFLPSSGACFTRQWAPRRIIKREMGNIMKHPGKFGYHTCLALAHSFLHLIWGHARHTKTIQDLVRSDSVNRMLIRSLKITARWLTVDT